jgi:hypothetical protein
MAESSVKRVKYDPSIAIIPADVQWPPKSLMPVENVTKPPDVTDLQDCLPSKSNKVKISRNVKQYINARYDEFIAKQKSLGFCVCQYRRRILFPSIFN